MKNILLISLIGLWSLTTSASHHVQTPDQSSINSQNSEFWLTELNTLKKAMIDKECCEAFCTRWSETPYPYDVDRLISPTIAKTWGDYITENLINLSPSIYIENLWAPEEENPVYNTLALRVAQCVQQSRTYKYNVFITLFELWTAHYNSKDFDNLVLWFTAQPINIDAVTIPWLGKSAGDCLDSLLLQPNSHHDVYRFTLMTYRRRMYREALLRFLVTSKRSSLLAAKNKCD